VGHSTLGGITRRLVLIGFVVLAAALSTSPAHAAAVVSRFSNSNTEVFPVSGYFCLPDEVGTATQTETTTGQAVEAASGAFTVHGKSVFDIRVTFPDGTYVQSGPLNRDVFAFVLNSPLTAFTRTVIDVETIYNAQALPVGKIAIHETIHTTYTDLNGNGQPDEGEIKVTFDRFRLRCA
jgi:hypothetical protein